MTAPTHGKDTAASADLHTHVVEVSHPASGMPAMSDAEVEECLEELRTLVDHYRKELSSAVRQLGLGGLAIIWLFKVTSGQGTEAMIELPPSLLWPLIFLVLALGADFLLWALGSVYWGLDRRLYFDQGTSTFRRRVMRWLSRVEVVQAKDGAQIPAVRQRFVSGLVGFSILFLMVAYVLLLKFLARRVLF